MKVLTGKLTVIFNLFYTMIKKVYFSLGLLITLTTYSYGSTNLESIALYPLDFSQYQQHQKNGQEVSELITSLLMIELSKSNKFKLLDRTALGLIFTEKSLLIDHGGRSSTALDLYKLPIANFSLLGSIDSIEKNKFFTIKLINNQTAEIMATSRFEFTLEKIDKSITTASNRIELWLMKLKKNKQISRDKNEGVIKKISFGHFIDINENDDDLFQGKELTERLISSHLNKKNTKLLLRTQMFPLMFEKYLRDLQYTSEGEKSKRENSNYFIHGKYRVNKANSQYPISIYLYIDQLKYGRELFVLQAENWQKAYGLINETVTNFFSFINDVVDESKIKKSKDLLLKGLNTRGAQLNKKKYTDENKISRFDIERLKSKIKPENVITSRGFIEQSLTKNPHNLYAKLALAMFYEYDGNIHQADKLLTEVIRYQHKPTLKIAFNLRQKLQNKFKRNPQAFTPILGIKKSELIYQQLIDTKYLTSRGYFNSNYKSEQVNNQSHRLILADLNPNIAIQVFEKIRSINHHPSRLSRYPEINAEEKFQEMYFEQKNIEAIVNFDIARTATRIYIEDRDKLPEVKFSKQFDYVSKIRQQLNLDIGIDGFSSSVYLDNTYLKAMVLLGYSLCQIEQKCNLGKMIASWLVDNTQAANVKENARMSFNVTKDIKERDNLIFLAANIVDRVQESNFTNMFKHTLYYHQYFIKNAESKLTHLLTLKSNSSVITNNTRIIKAYGRVIGAQCEWLSKSQKYKTAENFSATLIALAKLVLKNKNMKILRKTVLSGIEKQCLAYPYLALNMKFVDISVSAEQLSLMKRVISINSPFVEDNRLMQLTVNLFVVQLAKDHVDIAKQYLKLFEHYYGISDSTAMDFAYFYYQIGEKEQALSLLKKYNKQSFTVNTIKEKNKNLASVKGKYLLTGFNKEGEIEFRHKDHPNIYFVYTPFKIKKPNSYSFISPHTYSKVGKNNTKWKLMPMEFEGYEDKNHLELLTLRSIYSKFVVKMEWENNQLIQKAMTNTKKNSDIEISSIVTNIEVQALTDKQLKLSLFQLEKNFLKSRRNLNAFSMYSTMAIRGFPYRNTIGPLREEYFNKYFTVKRKFDVVKDELFKSGLITVNGKPTNISQVTKKINSTFKNYSELERSNIVYALAKANAVKYSGAVEIYHKKGDEWSIIATLIPEDAIANRHFGAAVAISKKEALVCDYKGGLYSFIKEGSKWLQQQRIKSPCNNVVMNKDWATVSSNGSVFVFKKQENIWLKYQTLIPNNYKKNKHDGDSFEYFGKSIGMNNNSIVIGNPYGGPNRKGEVYLYSKINNIWQQTSLLIAPDDDAEIGHSLAVTEDIIAVGDISRGKFEDKNWQSGRVYIYKQNNNEWRVNSILIPKGTPREERFGKRIIFDTSKNDQTLLIKSSKRIYDYDY